MHAAELVEVAGIVAHHGPLLVASSRGPSLAYVEQYWAASKCRVECWRRTLSSSGTLAAIGAPLQGENWAQLEATLEEIFTGELLTRVWTAILVAHDRAQNHECFEPIARSALGAHLEARSRALALLVDGRLCTTEDAVSINRIRRRAERWVDVLIGGLLESSDVSEFAIDPNRAEDFALDLAPRESRQSARQAWQLTMASLRSAFGARGTDAANPDPNSRIAASVLACFPPDLFDSTGMFQSLWMMRLSAAATDAQGMIGDLLKPAPSRARGDWQMARRYDRRL